MIRLFGTRSTLSAVAFFFASALALAPKANAQVLTGTLTGTVSDPASAVVPNVVVTATDTGSGRKYTEKTNAEGVYTFTNLPNSTYTVVVEPSGFAKTEVANIRVDVSQTAHINVKLEIAKTGSEIVVEAQQTALQSDSAELKNIGRSCATRHHASADPKSSRPGEDVRRHHDAEHHQRHRRRRVRPRPAR